MRQPRAVAAETPPRLPERLVDADDVPTVEIPDRDESDDSGAIRKKSGDAAVTAGPIREGGVAAVVEAFEPAKNLPLRNVGLAGTTPSQFGECCNLRAGWQEHSRAVTYCLSRPKAQQGKNYAEAAARCGWSYDSQSPVCPSESNWFRALPGHRRTSSFFSGVSGGNDLK